MENNVLPETEGIIDVSKPLFYGFIVLTATSILVAPSSSGTFLGVAMMAAVSFVSASVSEMLDEKWDRFLKGLALLTLLITVLSGSYLSVILAL